MSDKKESRVEQLAIDVDNTTSWVNGKPACGVSVFDRGLAYGDGVFETIRVSSGAPVLFDQHMARLSRGVSVLSIPLDISLLLDEISNFLRGRLSGVLKIIITHGVGGRGYGSPVAPEPSRILSWHPLVEYPTSFYSKGVSLFSCKTVLGQNPALAGIKHLNRLEQVLARKEWDGQKFQEGLMCDADGFVVEAVFSNVWMVRDNCLMTPTLDRSGVAGVMREWLFDVMTEQGVKVSERNVPHGDMATMDEVFLSNSVFGVWPVKLYREWSWNPGEITRLCQRLVSDRLFT